MPSRPPHIKTRADMPALADILTRSLDHVQLFVDRNAKTLSKTDWIASQQRILDHNIETAKRSIARLSGPDAPENPAQTFRMLILDALENAHDTLGVLQEEAQRNHFGETFTELAQGTLSFLKHEVDLGFEAGDILSHALADSPTFRRWGWATTRRPGVVTRVEIESDTGTLHPHMSPTH